MNVLDAFAVNKPCSERGMQLLLQTIAIVATSVVLGINQLLLKLAARGLTPVDRPLLLGELKSARM